MSIPLPNTAALLSSQAGAQSQRDSARYFSKPDQNSDEALNLGPGLERQEPRGGSRKGSNRTSKVKPGPIRGKTAPRTSTATKDRESKRRADGNVCSVQKTHPTEPDRYADF